MVYIPSKCPSVLVCAHGEEHIWTGLKQPGLQ